MEILIMFVNQKNETNVSDAKSLVNILSSALDIEEQLIQGVYRNYTDPADWPLDLEPHVFEIIKDNLNVLIEDSQKHEMTLRDLVRQYDRDKKQDKNKIIRERELMERFELSTKDFYAKVSLDPQIEEQHIKDTFKDMAEEEQRHAVIVREIIDMLNSV
jgi:rubrerythrin